MTMYTNGLTGQKYRSVIDFKDAAGMTRCFLVDEFADASEHVVMEEFGSAVVAHNGEFRAGWTVVAGWAQS